MWPFSKKEEKTLEEKQEKAFKWLEKNASEAFKERLLELMPWQSGKNIKIENLREIAPDGMLRVKLIAEIDLIAAMQTTASKDVNATLVRQMAARLLDYFIDDDISFLNNINDDLSIDDFVIIAGEYYTKLHGDKEWDRAMAAIGNKPPDVRCDYIYILEFYPSYLVEKGLSFGPDNRNLQMETQFSTDSVFITDDDCNGRLPFSVWIQKFIKGQAGQISKDYVVKRNKLLQQRK